MVTVDDFFINFSLWTVDEQKQAQTELLELLGVPSADLPAMTDAELTQALSDVVAEIKTRPTAVITPCESILFGPQTIIEEVS